MTLTPRRHLRRTLRLALPATLAALATTASLLPDATASSADHRRPPNSPDVARLAGTLATQDLTWGECIPGFPAGDLECATVRIPRDWTTPRDGRTWPIRVSRIGTLSPSDPAYEGTLFTNPGGPGAPAIFLPNDLAERSPRLLEHHNIVSFDPRGTTFVDPEARAVCTGTYTPDPADPYAKQRAIARTCANDPDVRTITTEQTAYDMDLIRHVMGLEQIDYLGYSYGTWLGTWYANLFGSHVDEMVLDSTIDTTQRTLEPVWQLQPRGRDRQFQLHLASWMARQDAAYGLGTAPAAIVQRYLAAAARIGDQAVRDVWSFDSRFAGFQSNALYPKAATAIIAIIRTAEEGTALGTDPAQRTAAVLTRMADLPGAGSAADRARLRDTATALRDVARLDPPSSTEPVPFVFDSAFDMIRCNDGQWTQGARARAAYDARLAVEAPLSVSIGAVPDATCSFWPTRNSMPRSSARTFPDTLVLQSELDSQTPYEGAYRAITRQPNTRSVVIDNEGTHGLFPYGTSCVDDPVYRFLETGRRPRAELTLCQAKPLPQESVTYESWTPLDRKGRTTRPVTSPFVPAGSTPPRPRGGYAESGLSTVRRAEAERLRAAMAEHFRARYGERAVERLDLD